MKTQTSLILTIPDCSQHSKLIYYSITTSKWLLSCLYKKIDFLWNRETSIIHGIQISTTDRPHEPHKGYLVKFHSFSFKLSLCICDTLSYIQVTNVTHFNTRAQPYKRPFRQSSNFHAFKKTSPFQTTFKPVYLVWNRNRWNNWFYS